MGNPLKKGLRAIGKGLASVSPPTIARNRAQSRHTGQIAGWNKQALRDTQEAQARRRQRR